MDVASTHSSKSNALPTLTSLWGPNPRIGYVVRNDLLVPWPADEQRDRLAARASIHAKIRQIIDEVNENLIDEHVAFTIGKTGIHARQNTNFDPNNVNTWHVTHKRVGPAKRFKDKYKPENYNTLIPVACITRQRVPENDITMYPRKCQDRYTCDLEEDLIAMFQDDEQLGQFCRNSVKYSRGASPKEGCVGYLIYVAIKFELDDILEDEPEEDTPESDDEVSENDDSETEA